jgi:hypothetical protein
MAGLIRLQDSERRVPSLAITANRGKNPDIAGILKYERSLLTYRFGAGCVFFEALAGQLPVPRPMA